ncbi:MAG: sporulation initiation factor Spo0A C-terminal domain-containing protein [Bacilli bacterium]|nr:sporulation initiation factor Spo0A C-terminal domain-containing protein [Bacilli bacterium]
MNKNEKEVGILLHRLGVSSKYHGFDYLNKCVCLLLENEVYRHKTMNFLYERIAEEFNCTSKCIERNIRTCIDRSWNKVSYDTVDHVFGSTMNYEDDCPTNRDFIMNLLDFFKFNK